MAFDRSYRIEIGSKSQGRSRVRIRCLPSIFAKHPPTDPRKIERNLHPAREIDIRAKRASSIRVISRKPPELRKQSGIADPTAATNREYTGVDQSGSVVFKRDISAARDRGDKRRLVRSFTLIEGETHVAMVASGGGFVAINLVSVQPVRRHLTFVRAREPERERGRKGRRRLCASRASSRVSPLALHRLARRQLVIIRRR